ncbi:MAG: DUF2784 family protein [Candidatus Eisenbacteria bacterium]|nr:DUF2784 family protein [Candidatus Eisenbacteria bacterium]
MEVPVIYDLLADAVVLLHFGFILFVVFGGFTALRWPALRWFHLPAFLYGVAIEWFGWICPLTYVEIWLRARGTYESYAGGFIDHYIMPIVYPPGLTRGMQWTLGGVILILNVGLHIIIWRRARRRAGR